MHAKNIVTFLAFLMFFIIGVGLGQFSQGMASAADFRDYQIESWAKGDPDRLATVDKFRKQCLSPRRMNTTENNPSPFMTLKECGEKLGAHDLMAYLDKSKDVIHTVGWPLSYLQ